jgi:hypothetical protein
VENFGLPVEEFEERIWQCDMPIADHLIAIAHMDE